MATKPTSHTAQWDSNGTNTSPTTAGHKTDGVPDDDIPTAKEWNYWMKSVSDWLGWLYEAEVNDGVVNYSLTANQNNWDPTGAGNTTNVHTICVTPDVDDWSLRGLVGGVDKREIEIVNVGTKRIYLIHESGSATAANRFTLPAALIAVNSSIIIAAGGSVRLRYRSATSRWVVIGTMGCLKKDNLMVAAVGGSSPNTASPEQSIATSGHVVLSKGGDSAAFWYMPVSFPIGSFLIDFHAYVKKLSNASTTINASLIKRASNSDSVTTVGTGSNNANAPGYVGVGQSNIDHVVAYTADPAQEFYYIQVTSDDAGTDDWILNARIAGWFPCN